MNNVPMAKKGVGVVVSRSETARRKVGGVRLVATAVGLFSIVLSMSVVGGCSSMREEPIYVERASLPASVLEDGTLAQIQNGGIFWKGDVNIPFFGYDSDDEGPVAHIMVGHAKKSGLGGSYYLHVGESVDVSGIGTVTLVSFDRNTGIQAITLLFKPEE